MVGVVGPSGAEAVSTGRGWELEFTLNPWRRDPPPEPRPAAEVAADAPGDDPAAAPVDRATHRTPLVVRGPVGPADLDRLRDLAAPGATVRIAAAVGGDEEPWGRLEEVLGREE